MKGDVPYFVQPRADIRAHDKLDALDLGLHEHDPRVFCLGRVGIPTERLDGIRLRQCKIGSLAAIYPHREKRKIGAPACGCGRGGNREPLPARGVCPARAVR